MKLVAKSIYYPLKFKFKAGTSRGVLTEKPSWIIVIKDEEGNKGVGEASIIPGLSPEWSQTYPDKIIEVCNNIDQFIANTSLLNDYPSIKFAIECASSNLKHRTEGKVFPGPFSEGKRNIPINGLIWMGDRDFMKKQIDEKLDAGFSCIKMKIGAIDFETELELLKYIRDSYSSEDLTLRVDANGAFTVEDALRKLNQLSELKLHSIEQPVKPGQFELMKKLANESPVPVALDEELIGVCSIKDKIRILNKIRPPYIILKPSLMDGVSGTHEWIQLAEEREIGWWITSALESNVGLNAIAQLCDHYDPIIPQGLGTGNLYKKNISAPLKVANGFLCYDTNQSWEIIE